MKEKNWKKNWRIRMSKRRLSLSKIYSDHMVLKHNTVNTIEGFDKPGQLISLELDNQEPLSSIADDKGKWQIDLLPQAAGGPHRLVIFGSSQFCIQDVYFGEIWLLGGQSNMELPISRVRDQYPKELEDVNYPLIRQFRMPTEPIFGQELDSFAEGEWSLAQKEEIDDFSAIGYFYGLKLFQELNIPIGLIHTAVGGTPVESWLPKEELKKYPDIFEEVKRWENLENAKRMLAENAEKVDAWHQMAIKKDVGLKESWDEFMENDNQWHSIELPNMFNLTSIDEFSGVIWLKRSFDLTKDNLNDNKFRLRLGTMINADETYINRKKVGETGYRYPPRKYELDRNILKIGRNEIVIRLTIEDNNGGFIPDFPYQLELTKDNIELAGEWRYRIGCKLSNLNNELYIYNKPTGLFNAVIAPLKNIQISGVLFYQGESNVGKKENYTTLFCQMIISWRRLFEQNFPVYYVQLANYKEPTNIGDDDRAWAELREKQAQVSKLLEQVEFVPAIDLGEWNELHPLKKKEVADRLSQLSLSRVYNIGPEYKNVIVGDVHVKDQLIKLEVRNVMGKLIEKDCEQVFLEVMTDENQWQACPVAVKDTNLELDISDIPSVKAIRYAWHNQPISLLIDSNSYLPLLPFSISIER